MKTNDYGVDMIGHRTTMIDIARRNFEVLKDRNEGTDEERAELVDSFMDLLEGHFKLENSYNELVYSDGKLAGLIPVVVIQAIITAVVLIIKFLS